jgi:iron complex outermembrane receptor protein
MNNRSLILIFIILISTVPAFGEMLIGEIVDSETETPVIAANVTLKPLNRFSQANENGKFTFKNVPAGSYTIQIDRIGYDSKSLEVIVPAEKSLLIKLNSRALLGEEVWVTETRAEWRETPVTFSNMGKETIQERYYGQDIPMLLDGIPNVYSYSEAGNGFGYSHLKVRGFGQQRVGVMINGIPLNDPEDHQVYWIDMPDFGESIEDIQLQRGVGSSMYGVSTFGGSLNMITNTFAEPQSAEIFTNFGSYNTQKYGAKFSHELIKNYKLNFRFSKIKSDGYRDNSSSDLWSFFTGFSRVGEKSLTELNIYGGEEETHAAWYASSESELEEDHSHNPVTYDNEIDNFAQPHFELHHTYSFNNDIDMKNSLFYVRGEGYYEQKKYGEDLWEYGLADEEEMLESDLIRQKWVVKNHYGLVSQFNYAHLNGTFSLGAYISLFNSDHYGEVEDVLDVELPDFNDGFQYYQYKGEKTYFNFYANESYQPIDNLNLMANLYFQNINYQFDQEEAGNFTGEYLNSYEVDYRFFSPRLGANYNLTDRINMFANFSIAQREPTDAELYDTWDGPDDLGVQPLFENSDIITENGDVQRIEWSDPIVEHEELYDYEFGAGYMSDRLNVKANLFWMNFNNEIIPYGAVDDDGQPIRGNADKTVHRGVELSLVSKLPANLTFSGNFAYNDNYFEEFVMYDWDEDWNVVEKDFEGNTIAGFPEVLADARLTYIYQHLTLSGQVQHIGKQYLDNTENEDRTIHAHQVVNAYIIYNLKNIFETVDAELSFRVNNIFDEKYYTAGYYDAWAGENYYWPAAERNIMAGLRIGF